MLKIIEFCMKNDVSLTIRYHHGKEIIFEFEKVIDDVKCGYRLSVPFVDIESLNDGVVCDKLTEHFNLNNDPNNTKCPKCHGERIIHNGFHNFVFCPLCKGKGYRSYEIERSKK